MFFLAKLYVYKNYTTRPMLKDAFIRTFSTVFGGSDAKATTMPINVYPVTHGNHGGHFAVVVVDVVVVGQWANSVLICLRLPFVESALWPQSRKLCLFRSSAQKATALEK